jgi:arylformamidase
MVNRRKVDLTFPIHNGMLTFPVYWHPFVEVTQLGRHNVENRETRKLVMGTHTGTHCDAPKHFIADGKTIDEIELDVLIGPAVVVDFSHAERLQEMTIADFEKQLGNRRPERLIMRFDWSDKWSTMEYYTHNPFISEEAAQWLVDRGVKLLGMDTPMPDNPVHGKGCEVDSPVHKILLGNDVVLTEYLCNLRALTSSEIELIVLPLKILAGDGSPARVVAIEG